MLILILMLILRSIKMKETALNSSIPPTTNLKANFTKYLKRDYPLHLQFYLERVNCMRNAVLDATVVISMMTFLGGENRFI